MSKHFLALLMLTALVFGCKPRTQEITPYQSIDSKLLELAKVSFEQNQTISLSKSVNPSILETDNRLNYWGYTSFRTFFPIWERSELVNLSNGNKVLITPLRRNMNVNYGNLYYIRRLRIEFDANEELVKVNIIELVTLKKSVADLKQQIIANVFEEIETRTNAKIMVFDAGYAPLEQNSSVWKDEATNSNSNARGSSNSSDAPAPCYYLSAVASCSDVQYLADIPTSCDPGDPAGTIYGVGNIINNCQGGGGYTGGTGTGNGNPPPGGGTGGNGDTGQDQPFIPTFIDYNGVNIEVNYKNSQGNIVAVDSTILKAYLFVINDSTFRTTIKDYLPPNRDKLTITFNDTGRGAKFNKATNTISVALNLLQEGFNVMDFVQMLTHEGFHAKTAKPDATITSNLAISKTNLVNYYNADPNDSLYNVEPSENMIQHEYMGEYESENGASILKAFYYSGIGRKINDPNITDDAFRAIFLNNLRKTEHPKIGRTDFIYMFISRLGRLSNAEYKTYREQFDALRACY
jgi:hypothetical protein